MRCLLGASPADFCAPTRAWSSIVVSVEGESGCFAVGWGDSDYNNAYWSVDNSGFNDFTLTFAFPVEIGSWTVTPSLNYMTLLDSDVRDSAGDDDDAFFAGIGLSTSF